MYLSAAKYLDFKCWITSNLVEINACVFSLKSKQVCNFHSKDPDQISVYAKKTVIKGRKLSNNLYCPKRIYNSTAVGVAIKLWKINQWNKNFLCFQIRTVCFSRKNQAQLLFFFCLYLKKVISVCVKQDQRGWEGEPDTKHSLVEAVELGRRLSAVCCSARSHLKTVFGLKLDSAITGARMWNDVQKKV